MIRPLFDYYQKYLLQFCNTEYGKAFLADNWGGKIEKRDKVVKVTPDGFHLLKDFVNNKPVVEATFFPESPYVSKFTETLTYLQILEENKRMDLATDIRKLGRYIYLNSLTVNPNAHPESTSVDGAVLRTTLEDTWANIHDGAGTGVYPSVAQFNGAEWRTGGTTNKYTDIVRSIFLFDTSSLLGGIVSAATFSYYVNDVIETSRFSIRVVTSTPATNTNLVGGDYAQTGTVAQATDKAGTSYTEGAYSNRALNATGISNVNNMGITKLGLRTVADATNSAPTWPGGTTNVGFWNSGGTAINYADNATNKPKLVITYTPVGGLFLMNMV